MPSRYVLAVTEEIGQDRANGISHLVSIRELTGGDSIERELVIDARIVQEHALVLAGSYALAEGVDHVLWNKGLAYAWV